MMPVSRRDVEKGETAWLAFVFVDVTTGFQLISAAKTAAVRGFPFLQSTENNKRGNKREAALIME